MKWQGVNCLLMSKYELIIVKEGISKKMYNQNQRKKKKEWKTPSPPHGKQQQQNQRKQTMDAGSKQKAMVAMAIIFNVPF